MGVAYPEKRLETTGMSYLSSYIGAGLGIFLVVSLPARGRSQGREIKLEPTQVYTNRATQFQFPPTVGEFHRETICHEYNREGTDIGVGYNDVVHPIAATVFVYPIPGQAPDDTLKGHFATCKAEVLKKHDEAKLVSENTIELTPGGKKQEGLYALFTFPDVFAHHRQTVRSEVYLFVHRRSFVLFRMTYSAGEQHTSEPVIKEFINGLAWP